MTTERGKRIATSIDGTLTGLGGNLIIIDDPIKLGDAMSDAVRERVIEWYRSTLLSRGDDKSATRIVVVMQRVHQNDLVGTSGARWFRVLESSCHRDAIGNLRSWRRSHLCPTARRTASPRARVR